jgi:hypothetical protein
MKTSATVLATVGIGMFMLAVVLASGAYGAYVKSVGTPYYAGVGMLAVLPSFALFVSIVFFTLASLAAGCRNSSKDDQA